MRPGLQRSWGMARLCCTRALFYMKPARQPPLWAAFARNTSGGGALCAETVAVQSRASLSQTHPARGRPFTMADDPWTQRHVMQFIGLKMNLDHCA